MMNTRFYTQRTGPLAGGLFLILSAAPADVLAWSPPSDPTGLSPAGPAVPSGGGSTTGSTPLAPSVETPFVSGVPVVIGNSRLELRFSAGPQPGGLDLTIQSLASSGDGSGALPAPFVSESWRLWMIEVLAQPAPFEPGGAAPPVLHEVLPGHTTQPVTFEWISKGGGELLVLRWHDCLVNGGPDSIDVELRIFLPLGEEDSEWTLGASWSQSSNSWAFYTGRLCLSLKEDDGGLDELTHYALLPLGNLVEDPASTLASLETGWFDMSAVLSGIQGAGITPFVDHMIRPVTQVSAYYRDVGGAGGEGVYLATADVTGDLTKNFRFGSHEPETAGDPLDFRYEAVFYAGDVGDETADFLTPAHLKVGVFRGTWVDAADRYRGWLERIEKIPGSITSQGLLATREDVSDFMKRIQHVLVLEAKDTYFDALGQPVIPLRIQEYNQHWGLDFTTVFQFNPGWVKDGFFGVGKYELDPAWEDNLAAMEQAGLHFGLYIYDNRYHVGSLSGYFSDPKGWPSLIIQQLKGEPLYHYEDIDHDGIVEQFAVIDPSAAEWQERMARTARRLAKHGVDYLYLDNFFPDVFSANFAPGGGQYGPGLTQGFAGTLEAIVQGGKAAQPDSLHGFTAFTEVTFESYVRHTGNMGPIPVSMDLVTSDARTTNVPLLSRVYHHYAVQGGVFVGGYLTPPKQAKGPGGVLLEDEEGNPIMIPKYSLANENLIGSPVELEFVKRGALYTLALGWVEGCPLWSPDVNLFNPLLEQWSYEITATGEVQYYKDIVSYAARLSRLRGSTSAQPFLNVGQRMRDVELLGAPPPIEVPLAQEYVPWINSPEAEDIETVPAVLHSAWRDPQSKNLGLAFANHTGLTVGGLQARFDPADYGLKDGATYSVSLVQAQAQAALGSFEASGTVTLDLPTLQPEDSLFLLLAPLKGSQAEPIPGGGVIAVK